MNRFHKFDLVKYKNPYKNSYLDNLLLLVLTEVYAVEDDPKQDLYDLTHGKYLKSISSELIKELLVKVS